MLWLSRLRHLPTVLCQVVLIPLISCMFDDLFTDKITEIEYRSLRDIRAQIYEMLFYWRLENQYRATVNWLCDALRDEGRLAAVGT